MDGSHQLILQRPVSTLNFDLKINFKEFFASTAKSLVAGISGQTNTSAEYGIDALKALGLKASIEQVAWQLVISSFLNAFTKLATEYEDILKNKITDADISDLAQRVDHKLNQVDVSIDADFFEHPQDLSLFDEFRPALTMWLKTFGMDSAQTKSFQSRLKEKFILALNEAWGNDPDMYQCIHHRLVTPFTQNIQNQIAWNNYSLWVKNQANARVFNEAFGLQEVYIPLRAYTYYEENKKVCDLHHNIHKWLTCFDKKNSLKVISGGPGSGKSSFAKIIAAEIVDQNAEPILFIPLHHFNMTTDLMDAIDDFVKDIPYLKNFQIHQEPLPQRLILIFDGLDELSEQGQAAKTAAVNFMDSLIRLVDRKNDNGNQWQVIVTGRDLSIQANQHNLRKEQQILHLLPYLVEYQERDKFSDEQKLLDINQCDLWWEKFGQAKGQNYTSTPYGLTRENLRPIIREPLLNYLLALSYERKELDFHKSTSLNSIYHDLLRAVYDRNYAGGYQHEASKHLEFTQFLDVLEEIAIAVWHGNGRTASEEYILERCEKAELTSHLIKFSESAKKGVVKLLTAFYFREFNSDSTNDPTFEFTHKSFGEYLTARRIVGFALDMSDEISRKEKNHKKGWSHTYALERWTLLTGPTFIDQYLFDFILNEVAMLSFEDQKILQGTFIKLLGISIRDGAPMEKVGQFSFPQMLSYSTNSETALLIIHSASAQQTKGISVIDCGDQFEEWLSRVGSGFYGADPRNHLQYLSLLDKNFDSLSLRKADFNNSNLTGCSFSYSNLMYANFNNVSLTWGNFIEANLIEANLAEAELVNADFNGANLRGANFSNSNLAGANLENTNLTEATLTGTDLSEADLGGANLEGADLEGANLAGADFGGANLIGANLIGANLTAADFRYADLRTAGLTGVNLSETNLKGADLTDAYLTELDLRNADLTSVSYKINKECGIND